MCAAALSCRVRRIEHEHAHGRIVVHDISRIIVPIISPVRDQLLEDAQVIAVQAGFVVVHHNRRRDVHRIDQDEAFLDPAFADDPLDLVRDVHYLHLLLCL
jgi:hypothetical protein